MKNECVSVIEIAEHFGLFKTMIDKKKLVLFEEEAKQNYNKIQ